MRIVHVNTFADTGGAAIAANRLHHALRKKGVESYVYSQFGGDVDHSVSPQRKSSKLLSQVSSSLEYQFLSRRKAQQVPFSIGKFRFVDYLSEINELRPDLVHMHWVGPGFLKPSDFYRFKVPVVWSMHDMWAFTGGCHYDDECGKYTDQCTHCPILGNSGHLAVRHQQRKHRAYDRMHSVTFLGLSRWMAEQARSSSLLRGREVYQLPNLIDASTYAPIEKEVAREILGFDPKKRHILFTSINVKDRRKGFEKLRRALDAFEDNSLVLTVMGQVTDQSWLNEMNFETKMLGSIHDLHAQRLVYSACDVLAMPSLQENLSNVIMEAMSCGLPVVSFDIGGNRDLIDHEVNGFLARRNDAEDFAKGLGWVLGEGGPVQLGEAARTKILTTFDEKIVLPKYLDLYKQKIEQN